MRRLTILLFIILTAFLLRFLVIQSYRSSTRTMEDTLSVGDYFLVNKFVYGRSIPFTDIRFFTVRAPRRGDVIVFAYPEDPGKDFVMRVVGIPGDEVEGIDKKVSVNGQLSRYPRVSHKEPDVIPGVQNPRDTFGPVKVPADSLFVMGDNRDRSYDSRFWGCVPSDRVKGQVFFTYWSWDPEDRRVRWGRVGKPVD